jgi:WD40 repeat protein
VKLDVTNMVFYLLIFVCFTIYRKEFAYSSSDKMVYIRKFSTTGSKMTLVNTLQGHEAEVTCVKWNSITQKWVTGSEDATIRIWV